jgi:hypothetical protein
VSLSILETVMLPWVSPSGMVMKEARLLSIFNSQSFKVYPILEEIRLLLSPLLRVPSLPFAVESVMVVPESLSKL